MNIVQYPHPALRFVTRPIVRIDDALRHAAAQMLELMYEARGVGLASTQVALPWRMFVYNPTADPEKREHEHVILNPVIMEKRRLPQLSRYVSQGSSRQSRESPLPHPHW